MHQHQGRRINGKRSLDHFPGVNTGAIQSAVKQLLIGQDPVLVIQKQCTKHLVIPVLQ